MPPLPSMTGRPAVDAFGANGAALSHEVSGVAGVARLVDYMKDRLGLVPVTEVGDLITRGFVTIDACGNPVPGRTTDLVADGDRIAIATRELARLEAAGRWNPPWDHPLRILYEDDDVLVLDKEAGVHVHPLGDRRERTLVNALVHHAGGRGRHPWTKWRPHVVQRLDAVVSGVLVVARNAESKAVLVKAQKSRRLSRTYRAMVLGSVGGDEGIVDAPLGREPGRGYRRAVVPESAGGRAALTRWRVVERFVDRTLVELEPESGRTHQLRVHLASLGHPIVDDDLYAETKPGPVPSRLGPSPDGSGGALVPIALHATRLRLPHPRDGRALEFCSAPPADFGRGRRHRDGAGKPARAC